MPFLPRRSPEMIFNEVAPQTPINKVDKTITVLSVILVGILPIYYYRKGDLETWINLTLTGEKNLKYQNLIQMFRLHTNGRFS